MSSALDDLLGDLSAWFHKGVLVSKLKGADGKAADSWRRAFKSLVVGFVVALVIESVVIFLFEKDLKFDALFGFPWFAVPLVLGFGSFLVFLLAWLWVIRVKLRVGTTFSLTCYVFSGAIPILLFLFHEQLSEAIRLFLARRDPSLPYLASATLKLLLSEDAGIFALGRAWTFFVLEIATVAWYIVWNLRRVLIESSDGAGRKLKVTLALILTFIVDFLFFRFYATRLYWSILGRLLS
jgi:hypothetical protein